MIKNRCPEIYQRLKKQFGVSWKDGVIITYYPNIYWIGGDTLSKDKVAHENTHLRQQANMGVEKWWSLYLEDIVFRLEQEKEAYQNEVKYLREHVSDKNLRFKMIVQIAKDLSSPMYGNIISYDDALALFR